MDKIISTPERIPDPVPPPVSLGGNAPPERREDSSLERMENHEVPSGFLDTVMDWLYCIFCFFCLDGKGVEEEELPFVQLPIPKPAKEFFTHLDSSKLQRFPTDKPLLTRKDFLELEQPGHPPIIGKSSFVSKAMVEHLMRHKKPGALGVKYVKGDQITNMEGALHTFVTPVCNIFMTGDFRWTGQVTGKPFGHNKVREVILSAAIHPDFELDTVMMQLARIEEEKVTGALLDENEEIPSTELKKDRDTRTAYDEKLKKHMIYHLMQSQEKPALAEILPDQIMDQKNACSFLEGLIENPVPNETLQGKFVKVGKEILSLEILYMTYLHQLLNELKVFNLTLTQGFVYTINPPAIFAQTIGGASLLNRLQALAFQRIAAVHGEDDMCTHLKVVAFDDYRDKPMVALLQKALPGIEVKPLNDLYERGRYNGPEGLALVVHNNSDAFGNNILTEGLSSQDGLIGNYSSAAYSLYPERPNLVYCVV